MQSGYNISDLVREAQTRWLKPAEVLFILQNYENQQLADKPPQKPTSGTLFLFNKRVLRFFRKDGHRWRRKKDGRTVGEAHERLKVGNVTALNCYYAHGEQNPNFQRRSYWMLDSAYEHIVLVHYRDISEGIETAGSVLQLSPASSSLTQSPSSYTTLPPVSISVVSGFYEPYQSISSPGSVEVTSDVVVKSGRMNHVNTIERTGEIDCSSELDITQTLRRLEEQLSLNDESLEGIGPFYNEYETLNDSEYTVGDQLSCISSGMQDDSNNLVQERYSGENRERPHHQLENGFAVEGKGSFAWNEVLDYCKSSHGVGSQQKHFYTLDANGMHIPLSRGDPLEDQESYDYLYSGGNNAHKSSMLLPQEGEAFKLPTYPPTINTYGTNPDYNTTLFDQGQIGTPVEAYSSSTVEQKQKFTIREISPEWGYASETTKVIIIGSFLCDPSDCAWTCMFGDTEVPLQIIQEGVMCCQAPPHLSGKVAICITSGNQESCSDVGEFEYRVKPSSTSCETEASKSPEELLLLVRFAQMLLSNPTVQNRESTESGVDLFGKFRAGEDSWGQVIEALLIGTWTSTSTTNWLLQELLKDKLQQWLSARLPEGSDLPACLLSKKEQGIIHMVAGLGYGWALNLILSSGVSVNFRDINGWTALHWAARFGRENMVAVLLASGASAGAVTDPNSQDPIGKTAASIAATCGHEGLAGYLSEVALTSHLSSLKMAESELSKSAADVAAERTVNNISKTSVVTSEEQRSLTNTLAAVRNAAQAAARIQSAFRAHSFRRRQQNEAIAGDSGDEYGILPTDIRRLSAASKVAFRNARDYNAAALSIQKKYRGWKGRKDFLAFRQKVVKIQAHVRGHQVRKNDKVIWAVGVLEKVVLRWRRGGAGLRGFRQELDSIDEVESEDEDIAKIFRKQKVDVAIDEAVSRVLTMVKSEVARQQYHRMLERYRQAKADIEGTNNRETVASSSEEDILNMDNDDLYLLA
ncbi:hypothetical protein LguiB_016341 [Lonicera macranthoides]